MGQGVNRQTFLSTCFIQDWTDGSYLAFQLMPDEVVESKSVNWQDQEILGRAFPIKGYGSSAPRSVSLQLLFCQDLGIDGNTVEIPTIAKWVRSLAYPDYSSGLISPPHPVYLQVGSMIKMKGVVSDVSISHRGPWDFDGNFGRIIEVGLTIVEVGEVPFGLNEVRGDSTLPGSQSAPAQGSKQNVASSSSSAFSGRQI